jgi:hypothetical protein
MATFDSDKVVCGGIQAMIVAVLVCDRKEPCIRIPLTRRHRKARLESTMVHTRWTMQHLRQVLFTDETRFYLDFTNMRARV